MIGTAEKVGSPVKIVHRKISMLCLLLLFPLVNSTDISDSEVFWEHEQFARHRHTAATLSALSAPRGGLLAGSTVTETRYGLESFVRRISIFTY